MENEKDYENKNTAPLNPQENTSGNSEKESKGDGWEFEASAPSVEQEVFESKDGVEFEIPSYSQNMPAENNSAQNMQVSDKNIVIKKEKMALILSSVIAVIVIAALVFLGIRYYTVPNSNEKMNPGNIALKVGDTDVSVGMYNYYYDNVVYEYTYYANYGYYDLDTTADFSTQYTVDDEGNSISWQDFFKQLTIDRLKSNLLYYEKGVNSGITLTDDQKSNIETQMETLSSSASDEGVSVNKYISDNYGANCGLETLRKYLEQYYIASTYYYQSNIENRPSSETVDEYFSQNENNYKSCSYALMEMNYDTTDDATKEESVAAAEKYASQITDIDSLKAAVPEASASLIDRFISAGYFSDEAEAVDALTGEVESSQSIDDIKNNFGEDIADWLFNENTAVGSTNYYVNENSEIIYVLLKTSQPFLDDTEVYSVRHILVVPQSSEDEESTNDSSSTDSSQTYTDEEWSAALEKANAIVDEYNKGDKTELSFAKLAEEYSDDTQSTSSGSNGMYGGGYEGVQLGQMVSEFENWATDQSRKYGDVGIVKSDYGYHIMYFIFCGPQYKYNAQSDYLAEKEQEMLDKFGVKEKNAYKNVNVATPDSSFVYTSSSQ
ncbi:MAG: peptidyl-prolyl cis-trans isomerase [Clostridiales bacterium]|nr:peptidyl-prolyl cis-trans isomerase [Clostridiales bacterium]